jgi:TIR domain/Pentapeptide repeats (8 copies)
MHDEKLGAEGSTPFMLEQGVGTWNAWRRANPNIIPRLRELDLTGRDLRGIDFANADLTRAILVAANLEGADLYQAELYKADLQRACLKKSDMRGAKLHLADLSDADLASADLYRADFIGTKLDRTNFDSARCDTTAFSQIDLHRASNLERVVHSGPSNIDISTLRLTAKNLPLEFLRGAGIPESVIDYIPSLIADLRPIQYHSSFISYSHHDEAFARRLFERLRTAQLQVWFAPENIKRGRKLYEQIDEAIHLHDKLLIILSQNSMRSNWVVSEVRKALRREVEENRRVLFPIRLVGFEMLRDWVCFDADAGKDIAVEIREYFIPDFSNWKIQMHSRRQPRD